MTLVLEVRRFDMMRNVQTHSQEPALEGKVIEYRHVTALRTRD